MAESQETPPSDSFSAADGGDSEAASGGGHLGQSVIPLVNKLQDIFAQLGQTTAIDLPQVAVVGSQSSGKSSVLEALVGRDFLPRGQEVVTRRPLVLQLVQCKRSKDKKLENDEWGEFLHLPGRRFSDFSAIREEIQAETARETGVNKGISEKQIRLKIYSPNVLNITLVDLPGITKVPVGDQPSDIEARVRTMILSYIKHDTCVILAVSPANADLANSDALQMARIADPDGSRTIGVITKLDIMDRGTDARNFLLGNVIPLRLGYVGVINRSQEDITKAKTVREGLKYEESFFRSRPVYHSLADKCGVPQLAQKLNALKARINTQMVTIQKELASYGEMTDKSGMGVLLLSILTKYSQAFATIVDGKHEGMSTTELAGGARIHYIFQAIFVKSLENATGPKNVLFVPEVPFEVLVRRQIARLLDPALQCARFVYDELVKISHRCETYELARFPILKRRIEESVAGFLREGLAPAETMIGHIINMEMDYINTSHPSFIGGARAVEAALQQQRGSSRLEGSEWKDSHGLGHGHGHGQGGSSLAADKAAGGDKTSKARAILARNNTPTSPMEPVHPKGSHGSHAEKVPATERGSHWGITSIFGGNEKSASGKSTGVPFGDNSAFADQAPVAPPPAVLRASEQKTEQECIEIEVTRMLLRSYYDIVRKNIQDAVPKAIMHFLVNHIKRELHSIFIRQLYREPLFEEMLQEKEEIALKRKHCKEIFRVLQQAAWTLEELPLDADGQHRAAGSGLDATGLPLSSSANLAASYSSTSLDMSLASNPYASPAFQSVTHVDRGARRFGSEASSISFGSTSGLANGR
eukprot:jgi/Mesen1/2105/ME000151S01367